MSKTIKKIFILLTFIISLTIPIVCAFSNQEQTKFFQIDSTQKSPGDIIEMSINLDYISDEEFEFILSSNINTEEIYIKENNPVELKQEKNDLKMTINKEESNLNQIKLYYQIPETTSIGQKIILTATIKSLNTQEEEQIEINEIEEEKKQQEETKTIQIEITIIEKIENSNNKVIENIAKVEENQIKENNYKQEQQENEQFSGNAISQKEQQNNGSIRQETTSTANTQNTVTYNGSSNNYLSDLKLEGCKLTTKFSKTNTTYFTTVKEETEKVDIEVKTEDDESQVCIYGNNDLKIGLNKILISVTAENGDVRIYRIYVTREGSKT